MEKFLKIILGFALCLLMVPIGTFISFFENESWSDSVGKYSLFLIKGEFEKLPE